MNDYDKLSNEQGISESIGFMLIFTIVIAGIALVTLYGYPLLLQQQLGAEEKIMEKNMIVLQNDLKSLAYKTIPFKETSLKIGGGSLTVYDSLLSNPSASTSTISIYQKVAGNNEYYINSFKPGELRYESVNAQTDISLQDGAVLMRPRAQSGSTMIADPRWFYDSTTNTMVINLINITTSDIKAKEGIGTVRMMLVGEPYYNETNIPFPDPLARQLKIDYTTDTNQNYSVAWDNYFTKTLKMPLEGTTGATRTYRLPIDTTRAGTLVIKKFEVEIQTI
jgi:hypothetical protein